MKIFKKLICEAYTGQTASAVPDLGTEYSYDANANITSLMRRGIVDIVGGTKVYGIHTDMMMSYNGNRLTSMTVSRDGADYEGRTGVSTKGTVTGFTYDKNGNLTADPSRGISRIEYNRLNLPVAVSFTNGQRQTVTYDGAGNKLRTDYYQLPATMLAGADVAEYADSDYELTGSRVYIGPHVFTDGKLEYSAFPGGYFDPKWGKARYYVTDWQGNHAAVVSGAGNIVQQTEYYPYGEPTVEPEGQRYLFGGKEREHGGGRNSYDFGARSLTPYGRWNSVDTESERNYRISSYVYCSGDPINKIDPDGKWDVYVSASSDRGANPYATFTVTDRHGITVYKTVVKVRGKYRERNVQYGDTPQGTYQILEWRETGNDRYDTERFGPDYLLATHYIEGEGGPGRDGLHVHGGRPQEPELWNTQGCFRIANEDIIEMRIITDKLEAEDPDEHKGYITVKDELETPVLYRERNEIKYGWVRQGGMLPELIVVFNKEEIE